MHEIFKLRPFFFDGAFGTYYNSIGKNNMLCEYANLNDKDTVYKIHKEYVDSGVNAIKTNTFGANSFTIPDKSIIAKIIKTGYEIALSAVNGTTTKVFADIGYINSHNESVVDEYLKISKIFIEYGAKNFLFETLAEFDVLIPALRLIKSKIPNSNIIVSFAVSQDGYTKTGKYYRDLIAKAHQNTNVDIIGLNCICGPSHLYNLISKLNLTDITFSAMPNSGYPSTINGRTVFEDNAEYFSGKLADIYSLGVSILGGCCGTTPEHIKMSIQKIKESKQEEPQTLSIKSEEDHLKIDKNPFKEKLLSGKKVIAVEVDPPSDTDFDYIISAAKMAHSDGADIITIADSPLARTRADSIMTAAKIKREVGVDVLPHLSCRDKNHIAIKASLLGANVENINNILAVTGDPVAQTDRSECKGVFSFNSFTLISFIKSLNSELFIKSPFFIGGALNINAFQFDNELKRAEQKIECGVKFLLTQPIFSDKGIENLQLAKERLNCKILAGILPIASYRNALFLNNEVSGIHIPDNVLESLKDKPPEKAREISVDFSKTIIDKAYDKCDGYYLMTPLKKINFVCDLIKYIKE